MVRVLGCSSERVPIKDLGDVIYYKQIKDFSDAEYESSKDLKEAISQGKLTKLEGVTARRGSSSDFAPAMVGGIGLEDLRAVIREAMPESRESADLSGIAQQLAPIVANIVHQEMSRLPLSAGITASVHAPVAAFQGPEYIPTISTEGMVSNVEAKNTATSGDAAEDALSALRKMHGIKK